MFVGELTPEQRQELERNRGLNVFVVRKESPAFEADLLPGDVLIDVAGHDVGSSDGFNDFMKQFAGREVDIRLIRKGELRTIRVKLNPAYY